MPKTARVVARDPYERGEKPRARPWTDGIPEIAGVWNENANVYAWFLLKETAGETRGHEFWSVSATEVGYDALSSSAMPIASDVRRRMPTSDL